MKGQRGVDTASGYKADCHCFTDRTADTEDDGGCDTGFGCRDRYTENCLDPGSTQTQEAAFKLAGTLRRADSLMLITVGKIMIARTSTAEIRFAPPVN